MLKHSDSPTATPWPKSPSSGYALKPYAHANIRARGRLLLLTQPVDLVALEALEPVLLLLLSRIGLPLRLLLGAFFFASRNFTVYVGVSRS